MTDQFDSLQVIGSRAMGGAERFYQRLCEALVEAGHRPLAVSQPGSAVGATLDGRVAQARVRMRGVWDLLARHQLSALVRRQRPAIVQTYMGRATRLMRVPGGLRAVHVARLGGYYDLSGYRHADAWVGNTRGLCEYMVRAGLPSSRVHHIGNFVDLPGRTDGAVGTAQRSAIGLPADAWMLLFTGRLHANKGMSFLLDALARLPVEIGGRALHLVVAGDGPLRETLQAQAHQAGLAARVHWLGWVSDPATLYAAADLFVCPSVHEPLGNVVLEAWAHGLPVVATRSAGPMELMRHEYDGLLVQVGDPGALADAMQVVLQADAHWRDALGRAGRAEVETRHSRSAVVAAYLGLYARLGEAR